MNMAGVACRGLWCGVEPGKKMNIILSRTLRALLHSHSKCSISELPLRTGFIRAME